MSEDSALTGNVHPVTAMMTNNKKMVIFPGIAIAITALCFNILGDVLSDRFGFRMQSQETK